MNEPRRLLEDNPTGLERELLSEGLSYRSSGAAREKTLAALGLAGTAAVSVGVAAASSSMFQKAGLVKLLALSSIGVAVLTPIGLVAWKKLDAPSAPSTPSVVAKAAPAERVAERTTPPEPEPATPQAETPAVETPSPKVDARAASSGALAAELGVLDLARSKLAAGDAKAALGVLEEYSRTYPRGRLSIEAEVLRIDALAQSGDAQTAKQRARAFLKRHPKSVLAPRVRRYLDEPR